MKGFIKLTLTDSSHTDRGTITVAVTDISRYVDDRDFRVTDVYLKNGRSVTVRESEAAIDAAIEAA